jgi:hypothetical protein
MEAFIVAAHRPFAHLQALNAGDDRALQVSIIVCCRFVLCACCCVVCWVSKKSRLPGTETWLKQTLTWLSPEAV